MGLASLAEVATSLAAARLIADHTLGRPMSKATAAVLILASWPLIGWAAGLWRLSYIQPPGVLVSGVLLAPLVMLLVGGVWYGVRLQRGESGVFGRARGAALALCTLPLAWFGSHWAPQDSQLAVRVWLLALGHLAGCYLDCRARAAGLSVRVFARQLVLALAYVAPAAPLLVVAASAALLFGTASMKLLGQNPDALRWVVNWGALHSPMWYVHLETRRACEGSPVLPVNAREGRTRSNVAVLSRLVG